MEVGMRKKMEGGKMGLRPLEERFRLRSSSYAPTSRFRLEVRPSAVGGWRLEVGGKKKLKAQG
jgi:hypothetical protein